jgi:hypothetical protein
MIILYAYMLFAFSFLLRIPVSLEWTPVGIHPLQLVEIAHNNNVGTSSAYLSRSHHYAL